MRDAFHHQIQVATDHPDKGVGFNYLLAIQRSILQTAAVASIDYFFQVERSFEGVDLNDLLLQMHAPADATPISVLDALVPVVRQNGWSAFAQGWFEPLGDSDNRVLGAPLVQSLQRWVAFRNSKPGHGVLDLKTISDEFDWLVRLAIHSLGVLDSALPSSRGQSKRLVLSTPFGEYEVPSLVQRDGLPIVIRKIRNRRGAWFIRYQPLDLNESQEFEERLADAAPIVGLSHELRHHFVARTIYREGGESHPLVFLPSRETPIFEGREEEIQQLRSWLDDLDSRACLVFGDGGVGKTTLALEFLHSYLEGAYSEISYAPEIICFYTAKLTRWTETGVVHFKGLAPVIGDAIRQMLLSVHDRLDVQWYKADTRGLIDKAAALFRELGVKRTDILLVLDNTETLSRKPSEERELAELITQISSKLARVLVTSRRREKIEARPIEVPPMDDVTGGDLLRLLANDYEAPALRKAGDSRLRKVSRELSGKPLLLDALARYLARTGLSIDDGVRRVHQDALEGLSEFLYEDAWQRISHEQRSVFLVLSDLNLPINNVVVGWVCGELHLPHSSWLDAFHETYFGRLVEYGTDYDIEFDSMAIAYFEIKRSILPKDEADAIRCVVNSVRRRHKELEKAQAAHINDRVAEAFRTGAARAAKLAVSKGDFQDAYEWYLEAIKVDANNSALFDRFAWFLMTHKKDFGEAIRIADQACRLDNANADAHFTLALACYRSDNLNRGDAEMKEAQRLGKPAYLCTLQKGRARVEFARRHEELGRRSELLDEAERLLENAKSMAPEIDPYLRKNLAVVDSQLRWVERERRRLGRQYKHGYISPD